MPVEHHWTWPVQAGVEVACGKTKRRMPLMRRTRRSWKAMRPPRWSWKMHRACWKCFANRLKVFMTSRTVGLSGAKWRSLRLAPRARRRRVVLPAHPQPPITRWVWETRGKGGSSSSATSGRSAQLRIASVPWRGRFLRVKAEVVSHMWEHQAWPLSSHAVWNVVCGPTIGFDGALAKELFAESTAGARPCSGSTLRRKGVCKVGSYE